MQALKTASLFKPLSRPSSPAPPPPRPDLAISSDRHNSPLTKLSLSNFRRPTPAPAPPATPQPLVQDGSYLEMLGLKLSEAMTKALSQPTGVIPASELLAGRRALPPGRGRALGELIASELTATKENPHLYRAIIRSLHRPLSVLLSTLSSQLLPLLSSPALVTPSTPTVQSPNIHPAQLHALAIATFADELLQTFDAFSLGHDTDIRGDGLKAIREGLTSIVKRVAVPLIDNLKSEVLPLIDALETNTPAKKISHGGRSIAVHPSIASLHALAPIYAKVLRQYASSSLTQTNLASFLISVVWRGLVALAHRHPSLTPPPSPGLAPKRKGSPSTTPPVTPPASKFTMKLPSTTSRPPSPTRIAHSSTATDSAVLYDLLNLLTKPVANKESARLACEAVDEAFRALKAFPSLLNSVSQLPAKLRAKQSADDLVSSLEDLTMDIPTLIALPVILQAYGPGTCFVSHLLGLGEAEYRNSCLSSFARADDCVVVVGQRVLAALSDGFEGGPVVIGWLEGEIEDAQEYARPL